MSPIVYIEAHCDICGDEICSGLMGADFAILRNGDIVCIQCRDKRPSHEHLKNFSIAPLPEPEEETPEEDEIKAFIDPTELDDSEVTAEEPDAIDRAKEEQLDRRC